MSNDVDIVIGAQDKASSVLRGVAGNVGSLSGALAAFGPAVAAVGAVVGGVVAAFTAVSGAIEGVANASARIDELYDQALGLGASVGDLQAFQFAMQEAGNVDAGKSIDALQRMQKEIGEIASGGDAQGADVFARLGLDAAQLSLQTPIEQFMAVKNAIASVENVSERAAIAQQLLGKSAADLIPALISEQAGFEASMQAAHDLGATVSNEGAAGIAAMNDAIGRVSAGMEGLFNQVAVALAPVIEEMANAIAEWIPPIIDLAQQWLPPIIDALVRAAGYVYDMTEAIARFRLGDISGATQVISEMSTAEEWVNKVAAARERAAVTAAENAAKAKAISEAAVPVDERALAAEQARAAAAAKTVAALERKLLVAQIGEDAVKRQEELAAATNDAERERIRLLQDQVAEQEKQNDLLKQAEDAQKQAAEQAAREQEERIKEETAKAEAMAQAQPGTKAVESRLLTRGPAERGIDKIAKESEKTNVVLDQIKGILSAPASGGSKSFNVVMVGT